MAKRIPSAYSTGRNVYPIIGYRSRLQQVSASFETNLTDEIDFDLQFEDNEVIDIFAVEIAQAVILSASAMSDGNNLNSKGILASWLLENPERTSYDPVESISAAISSSTDSVYRTESSLIYYMGLSIMNQVEMDTTAQGVSISNYLIPTKYRYFEFPQPYTVARNVLHGMGQDFSSNMDNLMDAIRSDMCIWGRRRKANESEFRNIIYRQRF